MIEIRTIDREHRADINYGSFRGSPLSWRGNDKVSGRPSQSRRANLTAPRKEGAKGAKQQFPASEAAISFYRPERTLSLSIVHCPPLPFGEAAVSSAFSIHSFSAIR